MLAIFWIGLLPALVNVLASKAPRLKIINKILGSRNTVTYEHPPEFTHVKFWLNHLLTELAIHADPNSPLKNALNFALVDLTGEYIGDPVVRKNVLRALAMFLSKFEELCDGKFPTKQLVDQVSSEFTKLVQERSLAIPPPNSGVSSIEFRPAVQQKSAFAIKDKMLIQDYERLLSQNKNRFGPSLTPSERETWILLVKNIAIELLNKALSTRMVGKVSNFDKEGLYTLLRIMYLIRDDRKIKNEQFYAFQTFCDFVFAGSSYQTIEPLLPSNIMKLLKEFSQNFDQIPISDLVSAANRVIADSTLIYNFEIHLKDLLYQLEHLNTAQNTTIGYHGIFIARKILEVQDVQKLLVSQNVKPDLLADTMYRLIDASRQRSKMFDKPSALIPCQLLDKNLQNQNTQTIATNNDTLTGIPFETGANLWKAIRLLLNNANSLQNLMLKFRNDQYPMYISAEDIERLRMIVNRFNDYKTFDRRTNPDKVFELQIYENQLLSMVMKIVVRNPNELLKPLPNSEAFLDIMTRMLSQTLYDPTQRMSERLASELDLCTIFLNHFIYKVSNSPQLLDLVTDKFSIIAPEEELGYLSSDIHQALLSANTPDIKVMINKIQASQIGYSLNPNENSKIVTMPRQRANELYQWIANVISQFQAKHLNAYKAPPLLSQHSFLADLERFAKSIRENSHSLQLAQLEAAIQMMLMLPMLEKLHGNQIPQPNFDANGILQYFFGLHKMMVEKNKAQQQGSQPNINVSIEVETRISIGVFTQHALGKLANNETMRNLTFYYSSQTLLSTGLAGEKLNLVSTFHNLLQTRIVDYWPMAPN